MAATKSQGRSFTTFIVGITAAAAGLAYLGTGVGKLSLVLGLVVTGLSFASFLRLKPLEGETGNSPQPAMLKLAGLAVVVLGWAIVLLGLHLTAGVGGRMITTLVGLGVSLIGALVILPIAANKNAIWKS
jgi:hypothetical protein